MGAPVELAARAAMNGDHLMPVRRAFAPSAYTRPSSSQPTVSSVTGTGYRPRPLLNQFHGPDQHQRRPAE
jgi:hypothetical protein